MSLTRSETSTATRTGGAQLPIAARAHGSYVVDTDGVVYLDGSSGVLNTNVGHSHPRILAAMRAQLDSLAFVHRTQFRTEPAIELTSRLLSIAPNGTTAVEYSNSGSEANECALRIALAYQDRIGHPERTVVLSEQPSYHGMTAGALALTGSPGKRDRSVEPLLHTDVAAQRVEPRGGRLRAGRDEWAEALLRVGSERVAAIIVEPLGGASSGAADIDVETMQWLRREADDNGFLIIADEVMSGFGRTGRWWACDHVSVVPDLLTSGKGVTGGYTSLAVTLIADKVVSGIDESLGPIALGHTMSANPLACATSLAMLDVLEEDGLVANAARIGGQLLAELAALAGRHPGVATGARGRGLMCALALTDGPRPSMSTSRRLVAAARANGLLLCPSGIDTRTQSVLVAPALNSDEAVIAELIERLDAALRDVAAD